MDMEKVNFNYSMKNVSLPSQKEYLLELIHSVEKFVRNLRWRAYFYLNPQQKPQKETYDFKSLRAAPKIKELQKLEDAMYDLVRNIVFRRYSNVFQRKLKESRLMIMNEPKVIVPADKSSNFYKVSKEDYDNLISKDIHKLYKKATEEEVKKIKTEHTAIVTDLEIDDRVFATAKSKARVTLKDHKEDFRNKPTTRLINPCKPEIGKISKKCLSRILEEVRDKTGLLQWKNSYDVIQWFKNIQNKKNCTLIILDVCEYYPTIDKKLLEDALQWASNIVEISEDEKRIILSSKKSLLYKDNTAYKKKTSGDFDVTMGSFDGAETSDIVGLFLLSKVGHLGVTLGCFRDDWLGYSRLTPRQTDIVKKKIQKIFQDHGLRIDIKVNKYVADFLDITLDMRNESYKPYTKPNHTPMYVHKQSNHPPSILKNIPLSVNDRLSRLSSSKEIFQAAAPDYQKALENSGYDFKLQYKDMSESMTKEPKKSRNRSRRVTYFNPPFSLNVETNVGKEFLKIIRTFPRTNVLSPIVNTSTVKMSYRTMKNMGGEISRHNSKLLKSEAEAPPAPRCNCQKSKKSNCPLPDYCTVQCVVYRALVTAEDQSIETYTGLTEQEFKKRVQKHNYDIKNYKPNDPESHKSGTRLSRHCGSLTAENIPYTLNWSILCKTKTAFNPTTGYCKLCAMEKFFIMFKPGDATLNLRSEFFSHCRHKERHLLRRS